MKVLDDLSKADLQQDTVLTIGAFDGIHRGHRQLIHTIVERARAAGRLAGVITFHPHPVAVLAPDRAPTYLTTPGEKVALLEGLGIEVVALLPFSPEMADLPARNFMELVTRHLRMRELWVGADFALGRDREGDVAALRQLGPDLGYELHVVEPVELDEGVVSSSRIRSLVRDGHVEEAARLLGRYHSLSGEVVSGAHRGRGLGFPTANLEVRAERAVPANGVYAVYAVLGSERYPAVANVGVRPSFDNGQRTIETHIFDFAQDIYGCDLVVEFVARLRDERRFASAEELIDQIACDSKRAKDILIPVHAAPESPGLDPPCPYRYQEVAHTADRALRVWGQRLRDLFAGAARGMYGLMAHLDGVVVTDWLDLQVQSVDREALLIDWLNELLYLTEAHGLLFAQCQILSLSDTELTARVGGVAALVTGAHIKAATYHDLALAREEGGWSTVITFDV